MRSTRRLFLDLLAALFCVVLLTSVLSSCESEPDCNDDGSDQFAGDDPLYAAVAHTATTDVCEPPPPCEGCGEGTGDPHITTFDGRRYDMQAAAELVASRNADHSFEVQWRQEPYRKTATSVITAAAMRIGGTRVMVTTGTSVVWIDGQEVDIPLGETSIQRTGVLIHHLEDQIVVSHARSGASVHVQLDSEALSVLVDPPDDDRGELMGLLGDADGHRDNDLVFANGRLISNPTWSDITHGLAEAWRVTDTFTLFDYAHGEGPDTYWDPTFPSHEATTDEFSDADRAQAEAVCRAAGVSEPAILANCIFDVLVTGDDSFADRYARHQLAAGFALDPDRTAPSPESDSDDPDTDQDVDDGEDRGTLVDGSVDWSTVIADTDAVTFLTLGEDHVLVQMTNTDSDTGLLAGIGTSDGKVWTLDGVASTSRVAFIDGVVVAVADKNGPLSEDSSGDAALIVIEASTGRVIEGRRYDPNESDGRAIRSGRPIVATGDAVLLGGSNVLRSFAFDDLSLRWELELPDAITLGPYAAPGDAGSGLAWVGWTKSGEHQIALIDTIDGRILDTSSVEREPVAGVTTTISGRTSLLLSIRRSPAGIVALGATGSGSSRAIETTWQTDLEDHEWYPETLAIAGDAVVGFTNNEIISGFALSDGQRRFDARTTSFENNNGMIAGNESGSSFVAVFGAAYLESYDSAGKRAWTIDSDEVLSSGSTGDGKQLLATGDVLFVASNSRDGVLIAAVSADR